MTREYIILCGQVVGNCDVGFDVVYGFDGERFTNRRRAIKHGLEIRGSDDFNVGVIENGRLVSLDWMEKPVDTDPGELAKIADRIGLGDAA